MKNSISSTFRGREFNFKLLNMHGRSKSQNAKIISNWCLIYAKWWEDSKSGLRIQVGKDLTPFLAKVCQNGLNRVFCQFPLAQKWVKYYPIWVLRPDLEPSHHFAHFRRAFDMIFAFWCFDLPCIFKNLKLYSRPLKVLENDFFVHHRTQGVWNHGKLLDLLSISKVGVFWTTLLGTAGCKRGSYTHKRRLHRYAISGEAIQREKKNGR